MNKLKYNFCRLDYADSKAVIYLAKVYYVLAVILFYLSQPVHIISHNLKYLFR